MVEAIQAEGVLLTQPDEPRRAKPTDHHFKVRFKVLPDDDAARTLARLGLGEPVDAGADDGQYRPHLGSGGLGVYGELRLLRGQHLRRGDCVKMEIRPGRGSARVRCLGLVAWVRVNQDAGLFRAGVGFVGVDPRDLDGA